MSLPTACEAFLWRKLDHPGHDLCELVQSASDVRLCGVATFVEAGRFCHLHYEVKADASFHALRASVRGVVGRKSINTTIRSVAPARWEVDGKRLAAADGCLDVDLGFTPATNLLAIRRLALGPGQRAEAPAVYLEFPNMAFRVLAQNYRRISRHQYAYEAPAFAYRDVLTVSSLGNVVKYPGLFELVDAT